MAGRATGIPHEWRQYARYATREGAARRASAGKMVSWSRRCETGITGAIRREGIRQKVGGVNA